MKKFLFSILTLLLMAVTGTWAQIGLDTPLTLKATTDGSIMVSSPKSGMKYSLNGGAKKAVTGSINVVVNDEVAFYGNGTDITSYNGTKIAGGTAKCIVYGNIMSLVNETGFATATTLKSAQAFFTLFKGNTALTDASQLLLPATTLTDRCYASLFENCSNLTAAPALPATTLAVTCYRSMFQNCLNLTTAPVLTAQRLTNYCYQNMFYGCTKLNSVTCLATDISATGATASWLDGVAATGTFTKADGMTSWTKGVNGIPNDWAVEEAPTAVSEVKATDTAAGKKKYFKDGKLVIENAYGMQYNAAGAQQ